MPTDQKRTPAEVTKAMQNSAVRLGKSVLEAGANYRSTYSNLIAKTFAFGVRSVSKIAQAGIARRDEAKDARSTAASGRVRALSTEVPPTSEHLTMRLDDRRPGAARFMFETPQQRYGGALGASILAHAGFVAIFLLFVWLVPDNIREAILPDALPRQIVWLAAPGPGGGGGGGNEVPEPPREAELPGEDVISVPAEPEVTPEPTPDEPPPLEQLTMPVQTLAAATQASLGVIESTQASASTGSGGGGGAGSGEGSGLGQGTDGGLGGGVYRPGSGVINPRIVREVKPQYTADAMRAKVQGTVLLECVVLSDGTVGRVDVVKSLDPTFGLDQEAVKAARQWRFQPGTRFGEPVAVLVTIELTFTLR